MDTDVVTKHEYARPGFQTRIFFRSLFLLMLLLVIDAGSLTRDQVDRALRRAMLGMAPKTHHFSIEQGTARSTNCRLKLARISRAGFAQVASGA